MAAAAEPEAPEGDRWLTAERAAFEPGGGTEASMLATSSQLITRLHWEVVRLRTLGELAVSRGDRTLGETGRQAVELAGRLERQVHQAATQVGVTLEATRAGTAGLLDVLEPLRGRRFAVATGSELTASRATLIDLLERGMDGSRPQAIRLMAASALPALHEQHLSGRQVLMELASAPPRPARLPQRHARAGR